MRYKTIFLDLDDTLIDTLENSRIALKEIYELYKIEKYYATFSEFSTIYFQNSYRLWDKYSKGEISKSELLKGRFSEPFKTFGDVTENDLAKMNTDYLDCVVNIGTHVSGAEEILEYLKPKYKIVILSNGFTELQYKKIDATGLGGYFDKVILSDTVGVNKPHPDIFDFALNETGSKRDEVIMIGDNLQTDITGAYNSRIDQIWFNPENVQPKDIQPTYIVNRLLEIKNIL